ncbi:MAG: tyrosine-type recombinase/integrase [Candidatus Fimenecus sp.]
MTGSLQQKNGKYYAVINLTDQNGKRKQKWIPTGLEVKGNKRKAEQFLRDKLKEYEDKENVIPTEILFSEYVLRWLDRKRTSIDEVTYQGYKTIVRAHIVPYFKTKAIKLTDLSRNDIQCYIDEKSQNGRRDGKGGLSAKSVKSHIVIIKQVLKEAVKSGYLLTNPSEFVTLPRIQHFEARFYTANQIAELLHCIQDDPLYPLIYLTIVYGLRRSEVLGLKWDSINFETRTLTIKHTVVQFSKVVEKDSTKTASSHRAYPITDEIMQILLNMKNAEAQNVTLFGKEYVKNDYIFKWDNGTPYSPNNITHRFKQLLKKYNLPIIRFHDLRHTCASLLVAKGFSMKDIQEWLGHSDFSTTANIYSHLDIKRKNSIADSMAEIF